MSANKVKISELPQLPQESDASGIFMPAADENNRTYRVPLSRYDNIKNEAETASEAATAARTAAEEAAMAAASAGATFTPSVDSNGNLSWTNDRGRPNPSPVNIKGQKGDPGAKGEPGNAGTLAKNVDSERIPGIVMPAIYRNSPHTLPNSLLFHNTEGRGCIADIKITDTNGDLAEILVNLAKEGDVTCYVDGEFEGGWRKYAYGYENPYTAYISLHTCPPATYIYAYDLVTKATYVGYTENYYPLIAWHLYSSDAAVTAGLGSAFLFGSGYSPTQPDSTYKGLNLNDVLQVNFPEDDDRLALEGNVSFGNESVVQIALPSTMDYVYPIFLPDIPHLLGDAINLYTDYAIKNSAYIYSLGLRRKVKIFLDCHSVDDFKMAFVRDTTIAEGRYSFYIFSEEKEFFNGSIPFSETSFYSRMAEQYPGFDPRYFIIEMEFVSCYTKDKYSRCRIFVELKPWLAKNSYIAGLALSSWLALNPTESAATTFSARSLSSAKIIREEESGAELDNAEEDILEPPKYTPWKDRIKAAWGDRVAKREASVGQEQVNTDEESAADNQAPAGTAAGSDSESQTL